MVDPAATGSSPGNPADVASRPTSAAMSSNTSLRRIRALFAATLASQPAPATSTWCSSLAQVASTAEQARAAGATLDQVLAGLQELPSDSRPAAAGMIRAIYTTAPMPPAAAGWAALNACEEQNDG